VPLIELSAPRVPAAEQRFGGGNDAVLELGACFERDGPARLTTRVDSPTRTVTRIEHQHATTRARQLHRGREARSTGPDDDDIRSFHSSRIASTVPLGSRDSRRGASQLGGEVLHVKMAPAQR
jgi:hypothetical protein